MTTATKKNLVAKTGNEAMAEAMRQINPDVVAAYPITPSTEIVQIFSQFVADGLVKTEFVPVESEHSSMSACIGASAAGARAMTATSSQGFALMWEMIYIASGLRLPITMSVVNRALSAPLNIHGDHSDTMGARDAGWIQIYSENSQEAYDNLIAAVKIAEDGRVKLPAMVMTDGFIISHCMEAIEMLGDDEVKKFVGDYNPSRYLLDIKNPYTLGAVDLQDYYFEHRRQLAAAMERSLPVIAEVAAAFKKEFGREYGFFESYKMSDAETAIIAIGSACGTAKTVVDDLRTRGVKAGLLKIRVYRPFPWKEIVAAIKNLKAVAILDRADSANAFGPPIYTDITSALYSSGIKIPAVSYVYGLGGRDIVPEHIEKVYDDLSAVSKTGSAANLFNFINLREE
ncbi:MAG: pyruvate ferredoxin oxidoreductase [Elusimicrobia bacterium HGW-Elusimicrobia-1]|jgi:pyruvate ferredoxin oxidoreductase alpha subunit|nr:MAG: pyruvate ferredoxin oxidoreductase [Elusimicrobia bacterium HGW-Elusimicrobia-1]